MLKLLDNNEVQASKFGKPLSSFTSSTEFVVKAVKQNFKYDSQGNRTDECISLTVTCTDPENFDVLKIKVPKTISLTNDDVLKAEDFIYLKVPTEEAMVYPWKVEYGKAQVVIEAPSASIVKE